MEEKPVKIEVLEQIAKDEEAVRALGTAIIENTLLTRCPFNNQDRNRDICFKYCWAVWTTLHAEEACPCEKDNRLVVAKAIVALNKVVSKPKVYKEGDLFVWEGTELELVVLVPVCGGFTLANTGKRAFCNNVVPFTQPCTLENFVGKYNTRYLKYKGNIKDYVTP